MSASLVGSEMCIRDRSYAVPSSYEFAPLAHMKPASTMQVEALRRQTPVSYTHLTLPTICSV
eukprot:9978045-Alexandrium_andersonii.AAC.1